MFPDSYRREWVHKYTTTPEKKFCKQFLLIAANGEMAGVLVLKVVRKIDFGRVFSRVKLVEGDALKKCLRIKNNLSRKADIFAEFDCEMYLRYYAVCVKPEYRRKGKVG